MRIFSKGVPHCLTSLRGKADMEFVFTDFTVADCTELSVWLRDEPVKRHIFIEDTEKYRLQADMHYRMFSVFRNGELIAHLSGEICKDDASVCLIVKPELCGKGIGTAVLCEAVENIRELFGDIRTITAYIFDDNPASRRCFEKAGFVLSGKGNDGESKYIYNIKEKKCNE